MAPVHRVLVVEDDERQIAALELLVREQLAGFAIEVVRTGAEALARLGNGEFDVVVLDDTLPDMRAPQLLDQIKQNGRPLPPVIVLSGLNDPNAASDVLQRGVREFVPKSLDLTRTLPILLRRAVDEAALKRFDPTDDHYQTLLEETYDAIYILQDSRFVFVNRRFEQLFGVTRAQVRAESFDFESLIAPQSREMIRDRARRSARGETLEPRYEFVACNSRGATFDVGVSVAYIEYEGRPATLGVLNDITERKAFEKALVRRNRELAVLNDIAATVNRSLDLGTVLDIAAERLISVMNLSAAGISLVNSKHSVVENHTFRGVTDAFRRHLRAIPVGVGIVGIVAQTGELLVMDDLRTDPRVHINELRGTGFVSAVAVPIKAAGRMLGVAVGFTDHARAFDAEELDLLTHIGNQIGTAIDKAQVYERLKRSVRRLVALDEITRVIGGTLDAREVFALAASQLHRLVGCERVSVSLYDTANDSFELHFLSVDGVEVEPPQAVVARADSAMGLAIESQQQVVVDPGSSGGEYERQLAQLGMRTFAAVPIVVDGAPVGTLNLSWMRDSAVDDDMRESLDTLAAHLAVAIKNTRLFSELESTLAQLQVTQERLVQAGKLEALGELAAGVAHDFNNVLGAILGRAQLLKNYISDEGLRKNVEVIERAALDGAATVRRIQEFSRHRSDAEYQSVEVAEVVREAVEYTQPRWLDRASRDGVHIDVQVECAEAPGIWGNAQQLREVLTNLINNACDAMPAGGRLWITTGRCEIGAYIEVSDTGVGMAVEVRGRIFDPFFTTKGSRGSGLGLSVSYGIIQQHKGTIVVTSEEQVGTVFRIELPTVEAPAIVPAAAPATAPATRAAGSRILVIDDEQAIREVLADILATADHSVVLAEDGPNGLEQFRAGQFDVVFTDLGMPGMSGFDVAREIKKLDPAMPIGLLTGWGASVDETEMRNAGIDLLVPKPFKFDEVLSLVDDALALRKK